MKKQEVWDEKRFTLLAKIFLFGMAPQLAFVVLDFFVSKQRKENKHGKIKRTETYVWVTYNVFIRLRCWGIRRPIKKVVSRDKFLLAVLLLVLSPRPSIPV